MEVLGADPPDEVEHDNKQDVGSNPRPSQSVPGFANKANVASRTPAYPAILPTPQSPVATDETNFASQSTPRFPTPQDPSPSTSGQAPVSRPAEKRTRKRKGLTPEQNERLQVIQQEQETIRKERVATLSEKLLQKISVWLETDRSQSVTEAFKTKIQVSCIFHLSNELVRSRNLETRIIWSRPFAHDWACLYPKSHDLPQIK